MGRSGSARSGSDMNYLSGRIAIRHVPLSFEKRMLDDWFAATGRASASTQ